MLDVRGFDGGLRAVDSGFDLTMNMLFLLPFLINVDRDQFFIPIASSNAEIMYTSRLPLQLEVRIRPVAFLGEINVPHSQ